jgi:hypothetical protein
MPRNTSVYTMDMPRRGKNTGPGRLRSTARTRASTRMNTSHTRKYSMLRTNFRAISGKDSRNSWPLKNASRTAGQFGECTTAHQRTPTTTTVLTTAMATPPAPSRRRRSREILDRRSEGPGGPARPSVSTGRPELMRRTAQEEKVGTSPTFVCFDSHSSVMSCRVPSSFISCSARFTHAVRALPFARAIEK